MKRKRAKYPPPELIRLRKAWENQQSACHICGTTYSRFFCTHHIAFKSQAPGKFEHSSNWIWICFDCHHYIHNHGGNEHAKLLECKRLADPDHFDRSAWLELAGKPESYLD